MVQEQEECRVCKGHLETVLDLGSIYPSAFLSENEKVSEDDKAPLVLVKCLDCGLVQLKHTVDLDLMYRQYWYSSSLNKSMVTSLKDVVTDVLSKVSINSQDVIVDIGCNDGTMLNLYEVEGTVKVGFDPALNLPDPNCEIFVNDYFSVEKYPSINKAKIVTAIAMFYDLPDPVKFVRDVKSILADDGIFVIQFTDLLSMIKITAFDNICHEHLEYYRLEDVVRILESNGLKVVDVSYNDVNGGSLRVTASHQDSKYPVAERVLESLSFEKQYLAENGLDLFCKNIETTKFKTREFLKWAKGHKHEIYLLGASTKGNTFLQVCEITKDDIPYAAEVNKDKFGLRTVGSNIEIISEEDALIKHPGMFLVPVWHFKNSILNNSKILDYMKSGGRLLFPLPYFHVVYLNYNNEVEKVRI